jgi:hypothetical protein
VKIVVRTDGIGKGPTGLLNYSDTCTMTYVDKEIPFMLWGNRRCLSRWQIENDRAIGEFYLLFRHCFEHYPACDIVIFKEEPLELLST